MNGTNNSRDISLDLIRTIASFLIVFTHVVEASIDPRLFINTELSLVKIVSFICFSISRLGVPFFMFLSGALILKKNFDTDRDLLKFYAKNLSRIVIDAWCWIIIYHFFLSLCLSQELNFTNLIRTLLFLEEQPLMVHMWYIPMIIGSYLILPFLTIIVKKFSAIVLLIPFAISLLSYILVPNLLGSQTNIYDNWIFGGYIYYFILGYWATQDKFEKLPTYVCYIISFVLLTLICINQLTRNYCVWYDSPCIIFSAFFLFISLRRIRLKNNNFFAKMLTLTSNISFQIYFVHMIPLLWLNTLTSIHIENLYLECLALGASVLIITWLVAFLLVKIKVFIKNRYKTYKDTKKA